MGGGGPAEPGKRDLLGLLTPFPHSEMEKGGKKGTTPRQKKPTHGPQPVKNARKEEGVKNPFLHEKGALTSSIQGEGEEREVGEEKEEKLGRLCHGEQKGVPWERRKLPP